MAKVKSSGLRNYVGRLGGSVYYMLKGQNIAREKAPEVSNPRTSTQMRQRMQWANIVAMYKCLQPYLGKKAFQNKPATWSDYNAFMSANLGATPVYLTKDMVKNGHALLAPYKVTEGSLPAIGLEYNADGIGFLSDIDATSYTLGEDESVAALSEAIINDNTGWKEGDQLGIIIMMNGRTYRPYVYAFELILDKSDTRLITEVWNLDDFPFFKSEKKLGFTYENLYNPTQGLAVACAFIHSRTVGGKTSVSTQSLVLNADAMVEYNEATTEEAFDNARESYGLPTEVWLDAGYQGESGEPAGFSLLSASVSFSDSESGETITRRATSGQPNFKVEQGFSGENMTFTFETSLMLTSFSLEDITIDFVAENGTTYNVSESYAPTLIFGNSVRLAGNNTSVTTFSNLAGRYVISVGDTLTAEMAVTA